MCWYSEDAAEPEPTRRRAGSKSRRPGPLTMFRVQAVQMFAKSRDLGDGWSVSKRMALSPSPAFHYQIADKPSRRVQTQRSPLPSNSGAELQVTMLCPRPSLQPGVRCTVFQPESSDVSGPTEDIQLASFMRQVQDRARGPEDDHAVPSERAAPVAWSWRSRP